MEVISEAKFEISDPKYICHVCLASDGLRGINPAEEENHDTFIDFAVLG